MWKIFKSKQIWCFTLWTAELTVMTKSFLNSFNFTIPITNYLSIFFKVLSPHSYYFPSFSLYFFLDNLSDRYWSESRKKKHEQFYLSVIFECIFCVYFLFVTYRKHLAELGYKSETVKNLCPTIRTLIRLFNKQCKQCIKHWYISLLTEYRLEFIVVLFKHL